MKQPALAAASPLYLSRKMGHWQGPLHTDAGSHCLYSELEVNAILKQVFDNISSLRRYLIDEQIMLREQGRYWLMRPHDENMQR